MVLSLENGSGWKCTWRTVPQAAALVDAGARLPFTGPHRLVEGHKA